MSIKLFSASFNGIDGNIVTVEVDISKGLPSFNIVGLGDMSIKESKERVRSAIENSSFEFPLGRITVNLAPADLRKEGSLFDLPIAVGILLASEQINICDVEKFLFVGELALSGELNEIRGALPIVIEGINKNFEDFIIPIHNIDECSLIRDKNIYPFNNLNQVIHFFQYRDLMPYKNEVIRKEKEYNIDFRDVCGQNSSKRALEIAAAGNHNIIMFGPPGSGKSMLAQRIPTILPNLDYDEALEVTKIYSVSGNLRGKNGVEFFRPFRNPHHTVTPAGLIGGGNRVTPGEVSLAHNGVLFLDEILEFKKNVLELLRQPLEDKFVEITRAYGKVKYPSNFMLVAAMNPCPCRYQV
ncbi:competence protein ComM [Clostridium tepidiprofundi DSM 19306]|uniref:Competence protein ComM n=1 Tax=Clostridium tepidiprofundi DSM 19306 TaxID=1121338 RepID=A0A151B8A2_9CLOT|nr:YifB family Mg chelatase-like AAA ATPase [Clostridium tepidiprofundi]KYH35877.1 competence protein ComM [Clostridium tepidiprofundi DSM 19306]